jgi:beta-catenin-like protein 1
MTSIDELFKSAPGPSKRKFENPSSADPSQVYKSAKLSSTGDVKSHASVADGQEDDDDDEAGPELPPDLEGDDDEGRFFGGGIDEDAKDAMDYLDAQDGDEVIGEEKYDLPWLRKLALGFEKSVTKNSSLRAKYVTRRHTGAFTDFIRLGTRMIRRSLCNRKASLTRLYTV